MNAIFNPWNLKLIYFIGIRWLNELYPGLAMLFRDLCHFRTFLNISHHVVIGVY